MINTTEVNSGRRLVISPFQIESQNHRLLWSPNEGVPFEVRTRSGQKTITTQLQIAREAEVLQFPLWDQNLFNPGSQCHGFDISLSTAVSLSARFPWLTPAGSLTTDCREDGRSRTSRLVDGGYFDNSGVDTALDVITQIQRGLAATDGRLGDQTGERRHPKIEISPNCPEYERFPRADGYALGDVLEPIRALLSTRKSRTPIAITRARRQLDVDVLSRNQNCLPQWESSGYGHYLENSGCAVAIVQHVHEARFGSPFYTIPLGWRLSNVSRDIIDAQSGRFWECNPNLTYQQQDQDLSNADCIQLMIYHQLNETLQEALGIVALGDDLRQIKRQKQSFQNSPEARLRHEDFLRCYQHGLEKSNASQIEALISQAGHSQPQPGQQQSQAEHSQSQAENPQSPAGQPLSEPALLTLQRRQKDAIEPILSLWDRTHSCSDAWLAFVLTAVQFETRAIPYRAGGCLTDKCARRFIEGILVGASSDYYERNKPQSNGQVYYKRGFATFSGPSAYEKLSKEFDLPIYENPDLLLVPEVSARAFFEWMRDPDLRAGLGAELPASLPACTSQDFDIEQALRRYLHMTRYRPAKRPEAIESMKRANKLFATCIREAKAQRPAN